VGETSEQVLEELQAVRERIESRAVDRPSLQALLPAGAARAALDAAFWDLEAQETGIAAWASAGLTSAPDKIETFYTIGIDSHRAMAAHASEAARFPNLKVKVAADRPLDRIAAVRSARPDARLIVDPNESWTPDLLAAVTDDLRALGVEMIEQPLPAGADAALAAEPRRIPVVADEVCLDRSSISALRGRYDGINIKLDKSGGLTEALAMVDEARAAGLRLMVGCNYGTTLGMMPALLVAAHCDWVDLDAPLLNRDDRPPSLTFAGASMRLPGRRVWG